MITTRDTVLTDIVPLGELALEAITSAHSSPQELDEVPQSPLILGEEISLRGDEDLAPIVAEISGDLAGFASFERRSMARSAHVVEVRLLVHPEARRQGVGHRLMEAVHRRFEGHSSVHKLVMIVAADDDALLRLLESASGWVREQRCRSAWARGAGRVDVESWANVGVCR